MTYDERLLGWKGPPMCRLLTLQGRAARGDGLWRVPSRISCTRLKGQVDLVYRDGTFYLYATIDVPRRHADTADADFWVWTWG